MTWTGSINTWPPWRSGQGPELGRCLLPSPPVSRGALFTSPCVVYSSPFYTFPTTLSQYLSLLLFGCTFLFHSTYHCKGIFLYLFTCFLWFLVTLCLSNYLIRLYTTVFQSILKFHFFLSILMWISFYLFFFSISFVYIEIFPLFFTPFLLSSFFFINSAISSLYPPTPQPYFIIHFSFIQSPRVQLRQLVSSLNPVWALSWPAVELLNGIDSLNLSVCSLYVSVPSSQ